MAAAGLVEAVAGGAEPLPQARLGLAVETGGRALVRLPLVEQLAHPGAAGLPLDLVLGLAGDRLGLGDDRLALGRGRGAGALRSALLLDVALGGQAGLDLVELGGEGVEVADDGRVLDRAATRLALRRHPWTDTSGWVRRCSSSTAEANSSSYLRAK